MMTRCELVCSKPITIAVISLLTITAQPAQERPKYLDHLTVSGPITRQNVPVYDCKVSGIGMKTPIPPRPKCDSLLPKNPDEEHQLVSVPVQTCMVRILTCTCDYVEDLTSNSTVSYEYCVPSLYSISESECNATCSDPTFQPPTSSGLDCPHPELVTEYPECFLTAAPFSRATGYFFDHEERFDCHYLDRYCRVNEYRALRWRVEQSWVLL